MMEGSKMSIWETKSIGDLCSRFSSGKNITADRISEQGKYPVYGGNGLRGYTNNYNFDGKCVLIGRQGAYCGNVRYFEGKAFMSEHAIVAVANSENCTRYLAYKFDTMKLGRFSGQAAQPGLSVGKLAKLSIQVPSLPKQEKISSILSTYDNLIEANNRRIELLEQTAQELYKEWFVRFRFPGYENAKFENGLPERWELKKIGDIAHVKSGYAFKSEWWIDEGVPVVKIKDIKGNTIDFGDLSHVSEDHAEIAKQFYIVEGDLLIAMTGATIGKMALVPYSEKQMVVNQRVGKFFLGESPAEKVAFLYMTLQQNWVQELIVMIAGSNAAQPNISPFDIEKIKVVYNEDMVDEYNRKSAPFIEEILQLRKQNQNLATQRDMLLPRLMSGKLEV